MTSRMVKGVTLVIYRTADNGIVVRSRSGLLKMSWFLVLPDKPREGSFLMGSFIFGRPPCLLPGALSAERDWTDLPSLHSPPPHTTSGQTQPFTQTLHTP
uniref:(California timema) hypothetical protein n=1 Tax=Timema californicum TaxID=61474 RepID=A0A7R9JHC8_TIMCA|nr:unnamed protein product [Timema californicum]